MSTLVLLINGNDPPPPSSMQFSVCSVLFVYLGENFLSYYRRIHRWEDRWEDRLEDRGCMYERARERRGGQRADEMTDAGRTSWRADGEWAGELMRGWMG